MPTFSVCIPCHNAEQTVEETLQSVLLQKVPADEVIVSDNCSHDGTLAAITRSIAGVARARILRTPTPLNMSDSINYACMAAQGDYVILLPADDLLEMGAIGELKELQTHFPTSGILCGQYARFSSMNPNLVSVQRKETMVRGRFAVSPRGAFRRYLYNVGELCSTAVKRQYWMRGQGFHSTFDRVNAWDFMLRVAANGGAAFTPKQIGRYRIHGDDDRPYPTSHVPQVIREIGAMLWQLYMDPRIMAAHSRFVKRRIFDFLGELRHHRQSRQSDVVDEAMRVEAILGQIPFGLWEKSFFRATSRVRSLGSV